MSDLTDFLKELLFWHVTQITCTQEAEARGSLQRLAWSIVSSRPARVNSSETLSSRENKKLGIGMMALHVKYFLYKHEGLNINVQHSN